MLDPLSITSGCVSLLSSIGKLSGQIYTFVSETRHAREDMDMVTRELSSLKMCLECLKDESSKLTTSYPFSLQENVIKVMKNCGDIAEKMSKLLRDHSYENRGNKMQWASVGRPEMNVLRSSLETHKTALDVALDMISIALVNNVKEDTKVLVERSADLPRMKHDTALIPQLLEELTMLRKQVSQLSAQVIPEGGVGQSDNIVLQRFLDESTAYAESAYGGTFRETDQERHDSAVDPDYAISEKSDATTIYVDCHDSAPTPVRADWNTSETTIADPGCIFDFGDSFKINDLNLSLTSAFDKEREEGDKSLRLDDTMRATRHYHRALEGYEKVLGLEHKTTLKTVDSLGLIYFKQGNITEAKKLFQRALEARERSLGLTHDRTIWTVFHIGLIYCQQQNYPDAENMLRRALEAQDKTLGPRHDHTISTVFNLGLVYNQQKNYTEAETMFRRALKAQDKTLGPKHEHTINTVYNLGLTHLSQRNYKDAKKMFQRTLEAQEKTLGLQNPRTITVIFSFGDSYNGQGNLTEAEKTFRTALKVCEKVQGPEGDDTLRALEELRNVYERQGKIVQAIEMGRRVQMGYEKTIGREAKKTRGAAAAVGRLLMNAL